MWFASPPPLYRGLAVLLALYGAILANTVNLLAAGLLVVTSALWAQGQLRTFAKFAFTLILPVGVGLVAIWGFIRQGAPGPAAETSMRAGLLFAAVTTLRLALLGAVFLAAVVNLAPVRLVDLLQTFGIRRRTLAIIVSTLNLWPDFRRRVEQVFAARCARGLMPDRRLGTRVRQLPYVVRTLFVSALGQALERADSWESSGLIERLDDLRNSPSTSDYSRVAGFVWLALSITWGVAATLRLFST
jgi:hypothetical protein